MQRNKIRVLFYSEGWGLGGIETFIMNTVSSLEPTMFDCTIFTTHDWSSVHDTELEQLGVRRITVFSGRKPPQLRRITASLSAWKHLLRSEHFDIVHINTMNGLGFAYAKAARGLVPVRIVHSHNSQYGAGHAFAKYLVHHAASKLWGNSATARLACSDAAGRYLFGKQDYSVIVNGANPSVFHYDEAQRKRTRANLGIGDDELLIGNVGRLSDSKNPVFLVDVLQELRTHAVSAKLMLIGEGPEKQQVLERAKQYHLEDKVLLPGGTNHPAFFYSALDVFTMPSLFEGAPFAPIEALACGTPVVCPPGAGLQTLAGEYVHIVPLEPKWWAENVTRVSEELPAVGKGWGGDYIEQQGLTTAQCAERLTELYQQYLSNC